MTELNAIEHWGHVDACFWLHWCEVGPRGLSDRDRMIAFYVIGAIELLTTNLPIEAPMAVLSSIKRDIHDMARMAVWWLADQIRLACDPEAFTTELVVRAGATSFGAASDLVALADALAGRLRHNWEGAAEDTRLYTLLSHPPTDPVARHLVLACQMLAECWRDKPGMIDAMRQVFVNGCAA